MYIKWVEGWMPAYIKAELFMEQKPYLRQGVSLQFTQPHFHGQIYRIIYKRHVKTHIKVSKKTFCLNFRAHIIFQDNLYCAFNLCWNWDIDRTSQDFMWWWWLYTTTVIGLVSFLFLSKTESYSIKIRTLQYQGWNDEWTLFADKLYITTKQKNIS